MARVGKSNTNKTIATAVFEHAAKANKKIGQLIFDPQREYARINQQDKTGLRILGTGTDLVKIYTMRPDPNGDQEYPLAINFYNTQQLPLVWDYIRDALSDETTGYAKAFKTARIFDPERGEFPSGQNGDNEFYAARDEAQRARLAFYATLYKSSFPTGALRQFSVEFKMAKAVREALLKEFPDILRLANVNSGLCKVDSPANARRIVQWIASRMKIEEEDPSWSKDKADKSIFKTWRQCAPFMAILAVFDGTVGSRVSSAIRSLVETHDPTATGDVADLVWDDLIAGRLVIIDLSVGSQDVSKKLSERLVFRILDKANDRFRRNQMTVPIQIMVEEAHNLFDRTKAGKSSVTDDPWLRLAKEAAKYDIGLIYATQEVSSIDQRILSNTSNWIIAHLNSDVETRELSHYYDYSIFAADLRTAEDRGYVRMKTFSGKYIVPTQIAKFDHEMINRARAAAGLPEVDDLGQVTA